jgi:hypothetical protein
MTFVEKKQNKLPFTRKRKYQTRKITGVVEALLQNIFKP